MSDTGVDDTCTYEAPCKTLQFVLSRISAAKNIIHVDAASLPLGSGDVTFAASVIIDGASTQLTMTQGQSLRFSEGSNVVMNHVELNAYFPGSVVVSAGGQLSLFFSALTTGNGPDADYPIKVDGGRFACDHCSWMGIEDDGYHLRCTDGGYVGIVSSQVNGGGTVSQGCNLDITRSRYDVCDYCVVANRGLVHFDDDLFVVTDPDSNAVRVADVDQGSYFKFSTIVNVSPVSGAGAALQCDGSLNVNSSIFAYRSASPHGGDNTCVSTFSLYDDATSPLQIKDSTDQSEKVGDIFANAPSGDFSLSSSSIGVAKGKPDATETVDLAGRPRPAAPSVGCLEPKQ